MPSKIVKCVDCGKEFPRKELNRHFRCHDCAWKKVADVIYSISNRSGPEYEKWKQAMQSAMTRL